MNEKVKKALDLLEHLRKATLDTDIDEMGGLVLTDESCFENEINELKDIVNDFDRYHESQQDLIKGKDEYIAKLCNDRAELKEEITELREFASLMAETLDLDEEENQVQCNTYFFNTKVFDLVKKVVEKYGKKED